MFCKKCGTELIQNARFCTKCGTPVPNVQPIQNVQPEQENRPVELTPQAVGGDEEAQPRDNTAPAKKKTARIVVISAVILLMGAAIFAGVLSLRSGAADEPDRDRGYTYALSDVQEVVSESEQEAEEANPEVQESEVIASETVEFEEIQEEEEVRILGDDSVEPAAIHKYKIVMQDVSWMEAYMLSMDEGGYLAHINSQEEMDVILAQIVQEGQQSGIFWIGGMRGNQEDSGYHWVDTQMNLVGESLNGEAYWLDGEPSLYDSSINMEESYMNMFYMKSQGRWIWNDTVQDLLSVAPVYSGQIGFIIEIEE